MIVADTCVVIWLAGDPGQLSKAAATAIATARKIGGIGIADITLYELSWLAHNKRISVTTSIEAFLAEVASRFLVLPVTPAIAHAAASFFDTYPADPMDRLIGATALHHGASLITRDKAIRRSKAVPVIW